MCSSCAWSCCSRKRGPRLANPEVGDKQLMSQNHVAPLVYLVGSKQPSKIVYILFSCRQEPAPSIDLAFGSATAVFDSLQHGVGGPAFEPPDTVTFTKIHRSIGDVDMHYSGTAPIVADLLADGDAGALASAAHPHQQLHSEPQLPPSPLPPNCCSPVPASTTSTTSTTATTTTTSSAAPTTSESPLTAAAVHNRVALSTWNPIRCPVSTGACTCPVSGEYFRIKPK